MMISPHKTPALAKLAMLLLFAIAAVAILDTTSISAQELGRTITSPFGVANPYMNASDASGSGSEGDTFVDPETGEVGHIIRNPFGVANPEGVDTGIDIPDSGEEVGGTITSPFGVPASDDIDTGVDVFDEDEEYLISLPDDEESGVDDAEDTVDDVEKDHETSDDVKELEEETAEVATEKYVPVIDNPIPNREFQNAFTISGISGDYNVTSTANDMIDAPVLPVITGDKFELLVNFFGDQTVAQNYLSVRFNMGSQNGVPNVISYRENDSNPPTRFVYDVSPNVHNGQWHYFVSVSCNYNGTTVTKHIIIEIVYFKVLTDSNNNGVIDTNDETTNANSTGKIIFVNNKDYNEDGIPDFADGFDCENGGTVGADKSNDFSELKIRISKNVDISLFSLFFSFPEASYSVTRNGFGTATSPFYYSPPQDGQIRIWTANGKDGRYKSEITIPTIGHRVPAQKLISLEMSRIFWETKDDYKETTLYVEAVNPSLSFPGFEIKVGLYKGNTSSNSVFLSEKKVFGTSVSIEIEEIFESSNPSNTIFNETLKDDGGTVIQYHDSTSNAIYGIDREKLFIVADESNHYNTITIKSKLLPELLDCMVGIYYGDTKCGDFIYDQTMHISFDDITTIPKTHKYSIVFAFDSFYSDIYGEIDSKDIKTTPYLVSNFIKKNEENSEIYYVTKKEPIIYGINKQQYDWHKTILESILTLNVVGEYVDEDPPKTILPYSRSFLSIFYYGNHDHIRENFKPSTEQIITLNAFQNSTSSSSCFSEWLTHNSGANFDQNGNADIKYYIWNDASDVSCFIKDATPFSLKKQINTPDGLIEVLTNTGNLLYELYRRNYENEARIYFENHPDASVCVLPEDYHILTPNEQASFFSSTDMSPSWVPCQTSDIGKTACNNLIWDTLFTPVFPANFVEIDVGATIGRGRILNPKYRFTVRKNGILFTSYDVENIEFICEIEDLYDFNYQDSFVVANDSSSDDSYGLSDLSSHPAAHQIAFGNGNNHKTSDTYYTKGNIYRHKIYIKANYENPFDISNNIQPFIP